MTLARKICAIAIAVLALPVTMLAVMPAASGMDPNPPKKVCVDSVCAEVIEFEVLQLVYGLREDEPIFRKSVFAAHGFFELNVSGDGNGFPGLIVTDGAPNLNASVGDIRLTYTEKSRALVLVLEPHNYDVAPIGEIVRARIEVSQNGDVKTFVAARWVRLYENPTVNVGTTSDLSAVLGSFVQDGTTTFGA